MPSKPPEIILRDFDQIVADLKLLIPRYLPEWTDHNESDPGITLLELFAYLADAYAYRLNQVPDVLYDKLLALLAIRPDPARPARVQLQFTTAPASAADPIVVPGKTVVSATGADGRPVYFETDEEIALTRYPLESTQVFDGSTRSVTTDFAPFGDAPAPGNALYLGFGPADPNVPTSLAPFPGEIRVHVVPVPAGAAVRADEVGARALPVPPIRFQWEYLVDGPADRWRPLQTLGDSSVAFTREGDVRVAGPPLEVKAFAGVGAATDPLYWLRCRLLSGVYPQGAAPRLTAVEANTVAATAWRSVPGELLGTSSGRPDQVVRLANGSVDIETFQMGVTTGASAPATWTRKDDLFASGPNDQDYILDAVAGTVTFGDGARGLIPPAGSELRATYRYGGGTRGNVAGGTATGLQGLVPGVTAVTNPREAVGGSDAQASEALREEAASTLRARDRAITVKDLTETARKVPGVARAEAVPLAHPRLPGVQVPGAVTVVVVPWASNAHDRTPRPTPELMDAVARRLDEGRPATAEVWVTGPVYRLVRVRAKIQTAPFASPDAVRLDAQEALRALLSPVPVPINAGTSMSTPRAFGAHLYPTSLYRALLDVPNVVAVPVLTVWVDEQEVDVTGRSLAPYELLAPVERHDLITVPVADASGSNR